MKLIAVTYSSMEAAKKPVGFRPSVARDSIEYSLFMTGNTGVTMSSLGPALLCATTSRPAAYILISYG